MSDARKLTKYVILHCRNCDDTPEIYEATPERIKHEEHPCLMYDASDVDALRAAKDERIAELEAENARLRASLIERGREITELRSELSARPTTWAYKQVCAANEKKRDEIARLAPLANIGRLAVEWVRQVNLRLDTAEEAMNNVEIAAEAHIAAEADKEGE